MKKIIYSLLLVGLLGSPASAGRGATSATLMDAINTRNADVIVSEIERAEFIVCSACLDPMRQLLDDGDYRVREAAAWWFARRPTLAMQIRDDMITRLGGTDSTLARNAADVLGAFRRPEALTALSTAVTNTALSDEARAAAVMAIGTIADPRAEPAVITAMTSAASPLTRYQAVGAYVAMRDGTRDGSPLVSLLADSDQNVRRAASSAIGAFKLASAQTALEQALATDPDFMVRRNAAWALGQLGDVTALQTAAQNDASPLVRSVAGAFVK
jgi:HEAT repeat protein